MAGENQPTTAPNAKLSAGTIATGLATVLYTVAAERYDILRDPAVMSVAVPALAMGFAFVPGYYKRALGYIDALQEGGAMGWAKLGGGVGLVAAIGVVLHAVV